MNRERRKRVRDIINIIQDYAEIVDDIREEEVEAMSNIPDSLQDSDNYTEMEEAAEFLETACEALDEAIQSMENAIV